VRPLSAQARHIACIPQSPRDAASVVLYDDIIPSTATDIATKLVLFKSERPTRKRYNVRVVDSETAFKVAAVLEKK
jgi:hypothetical protein